MTPGHEPAGAHALGEELRLGDGGDHRRHDPRRRAGALGGQGDRVELAVEDARVVEGDAQPAHAERRVRLVGHAGEGERLVRAGVERAHDDLAVGEGLEHLGVDGGLLLDGRLLVGRQEAQLGAEQPDALGGGRPRPRARRRRPGRWRAPATTCPSAVRPGPRQRATASARARATRLDRRPVPSPGSGSTCSSPVVPSTRTKRVGRRPRRGPGPRRRRGCRAGGR